MIFPLTSLETQISRLDLELEELIPASHILDGMSMTLLSNHSAEYRAVKEIGHRNLSVLSL